MGFEMHGRSYDDWRARMSGIEAMGLYALAGSWSSRHRLDGLVPKSVVRRWDSDFTRAGRLVTFDLWAAEANVPDWFEPGYRFLFGDEPLCRFVRKPVRAQIPGAVRAAVYARDGWVCVECGTAEKLSLDHIWPWSLGGGDDIENLRTLCRRCNSSKGARV